MPSDLHAALSHLKNDVPFPADRNAIVTACNNMSDLPAEGRDRLAKTLPEGRYNRPDDVMSTLLRKVVRSRTRPSPAAVGLLRKSAQKLRAFGPSAVSSGGILPPSIGDDPEPKETESSHREAAVRALLNKGCFAFSQDTISWISWL